MLSELSMSPLLRCFSFLIGVVDRRSDFSLFGLSRSRFVLIDDIIISLLRSKLTGSCSGDGENIDLLGFGGVEFLLPLLVSVAGSSRLGLASLYHMSDVFMSDCCDELDNSLDGSKIDCWELERCMLVDDVLSVG